MLLEVGMRVRNVPYMHHHISLVEFVERRLETINEQVGQMGNEAHCVEHFRDLTERQLHLSLRRIQSLEETIFRLDSCISRQI